MLEFEVVGRKVIEVMLWSGWCVVESAVFV